MPAHLRDIFKLCQRLGDASLRDLYDHMLRIINCQTASTSPLPDSVVHDLSPEQAQELSGFVHNNHLWEKIVQAIRLAEDWRTSLKFPPRGR
jgi:hypothetical protein